MGARGPAKAGAHIWREDKARRAVLLAGCSLLASGANAGAGSAAAVRDVAAASLARATWLAYALAAGGAYVAAVGRGLGWAQPGPAYVGQGLQSESIPGISCHHLAVGTAARHLGDDRLRECSALPVTACM